jgi:cysteine sulfinate desulfinase/cysteine desulfurase-like protein
MGVSPRPALATVRFSMGHHTSADEITRAAAVVARVIRFHSLSDA